MSWVFLPEYSVNHTTVFIVHEIGCDCIGLINLVSHHWKTENFVTKRRFY